MADEKFDVIVVGGGPAGSAAAYTLAKAGVNVAVIERGEKCGSKNMTGGRIYGHSLKKLIPDYEMRAPLERKITRERVSFMSRRGTTSLEFASKTLGGKDSASYSVIRGKFDNWLAQEAEKQGAFYINGIRVDDLIVRNGKVCGIIAGEDRLEANVVILADGVNSLLAVKLGLIKEQNPKEYALGLKEVIRLDEEKIKERFALNGDEGCAWMFVGEPTKGGIGGGFLYTNKDSISLGIVATVSDIGYSRKSVIKLLDEFKANPMIAPLVEGGELAEYSAHLVPEGGYKMLPKLYDHGVMLVGDAAAMVMNLGYVVRGMDLAIESGRIAAETYIELAEKHDFTPQAMKIYRKKLEGSFLLREMKKHRTAPKAFSNRNVFTKLPVLAEDAMRAMFTVDGENTSALVVKILAAAKKYGFGSLIKDILLLLSAV